MPAARYLTAQLHRTPAPENRAPLRRHLPLEPGYPLQSSRRVALGRGLIDLGTRLRQIASSRAPCGTLRLSHAIVRSTRVFTQPRSAPGMGEASVGRSERIAACGWLVPRLADTCRGLSLSAC